MISKVIIGRGKNRVAVEVYPNERHIITKDLKWFLWGRKVQDNG